MNPEDKIVSKLFLFAAIIILITYPNFRTFLPQYPIFMTGAVVLLSVMAGLTTSKRRWMMGIDIIISLFAILYFENHAIMYARTPLIGILLTDQGLVFTFVIALYFSVKNFRKNISSVNQKTD